MLRKEKPKYKSVVISPQKSALFMKECMEGVTGSWRKVRGRNQSG